MVGDERHSRALSGGIRDYGWTVAGSCSRHSTGTRRRPGTDQSRTAGPGLDQPGHAVASEPGTPAAGQPIAIVGLACRYPDADDPPALLDLVLTGRRAFRRLPPCRLDLADYYSADPAAPDTTYSTRAALIEGWQFDQAAFGVSAAAYEAADPAHWLALETTARALAAAGFPSGKGLARNRVGVVIGNTLAGDISRAAALRLRWPYVRRVLADAMAAAGVPRQHEAP